MNLDRNLKFRCPSCSKLYEVQVSDIHSEQPLFQCISCDSRFSFQNPPAGAEMVTCFLIEDLKKENADRPEQVEKGTLDQNVARRQGDSGAANEMKSCPKCAALNSRQSKECYACHVIFEKLEGLPQDTTLGAQPSLVRKWKSLLEDFQNEDLHTEFLRSCQRLDALKFAVVKYEELGKAQGGDVVCDQMIARIHAIQSITVEQKKTSKVSSHAMARWQKYLFLVPLALSFLLILIGLTSVTNRNLIGVGVALGVMIAGLIIMVKGRLSLSDFLE